MTSSFLEKLDSLISEEQDNSEEEDLSLDDVVDLQLQQLGPNPTLLQAVSVILKQSAKAEYEAKQARKKLERDFRETVKVVKENYTEIKSLKITTNKTAETVEKVQESYKNADERLGQVEHYMQKSYYLACENRQRNSKGNLILNGRHIPKYRPGENLLDLVRKMIYDKYGVDVHPQEFKVIHRVAGDRILFSLHNRLPGFGYSQLINKINSNPNPRLEVYLSIQLFEPYSDLFYIARRLKFYKVS